MTRTRFYGTWIVAIALCLAFWAAVGYGISQADTRAGGGRTPCATVSQCRHDLAWSRKERAHLQHELAVRYGNQVELGYELGDALYHVDLRHLGHCESNDNPLATTGQYDGVTQQGPGFYQRAENASIYRYIHVLPAKPYDKPVFVAIANILVAARFISLHGSSEWQCELSGGVKHGGAYS